MKSNAGFYSKKQLEDWRERSGSLTRALAHPHEIAPPNGKHNGLYLCWQKRVERAKRVTDKSGEVMQFANLLSRYDELCGLADEAHRQHAKICASLGGTCEIDIAPCWCDECKKEKPWS